MTSASATTTPASTAGPGGGGGAGASTGGSEGKAQGQGSGAKRDDEGGPMGWGRFFLYGVSGTAGLVFLYYFHKAKYSLHKTEILLLERWRALPLYPPPGPSAAENNARVDPLGLPHDLVDAFAQWFISTDLQEPDGVTRDDVLELLREMGFGEEEQPCKDFLHRGEGQLEERRRLSGAGLQESVALLAKLALPPDPEEQTPEPRLGKEAKELLRRKLAGMGSVLNAASALQQAMQLPGPGVPAAVAPLAPAAQLQPAQAAAAPAPAPPQGYTVQGGTDSSEAGVDDAEHRRMEATRLARLEEGLVARLERHGSLSPAEEARLRDIRNQRAAL